MANSLFPLSGSLFSGIAMDGDVEQVQALLQRPSVRIERIVSSGQSSPPGFWYDQEDGEWVVRLLIEGEPSPRILRPGDWVNLPPHCRHRVEWTSPGQETIWLAIHYQ